MTQQQLSASLEDYLLAIYHIAQEKLVAQVNQVAQQLNVKASSVTWALGQLAEKGLLNYAPREAVSLTPRGLALGRRLARRHHAIETFLTEVLALDPDTAHANACRIEHVLDRDVLHRMREFMDFLETCPRAGHQWMKGFGFFCDHGRIHENCPACIQGCLDDLPDHGENADPPHSEPLPKLSKQRDRQILERLDAILAESGAGPLSPARAHVVATFMTTERHLTPEDLLAAARREMPQTTPQDVDAALAILTEHKLARALRFRDRTLYEHYHPESHHDHLYCVRCGAIVEFFDPRLEDLQVENTRRADFRLLNHNLSIYGVCQDCIRLEADSRTLEQCLAGERVQVARLTGEPAARQRLAELGLTPGTHLQVLSENCAGGNVLLLTAGGARLMLDRPSTAAVRIHALPTEHLPPPPGRHRARHRHRLDRTSLPDDLRENR